LNFPFSASFPYFFYFLILLALLPYKSIKSKKQIISILLICLIGVFVTYEGNFSDWITYREYVEGCHYVGCTYFESGYDLLTFIASQTFGFEIIPLFSLLLLFVALLMFRHNDNTFFFIITISILFAFLPLYFGGIRQSLSFSLLIISFVFFYYKKYFLSLLFTLVAVLFHLSAIVMFVSFISFYFFYNFIKNKNFVTILISTFGLYLLGILFMEMIFDSIKIIDSFNPGRKMVHSNMNGLKSLLLPIERFIILGMSLYLFYKLKADRLFFLISLIGICGAIFYLIVYQYSLNTAGRVVAFFRFSDLVIIFYFLKFILSKKGSFNRYYINNLSILGILTYSLIKFYFTIVSVGFFA
jgi:hypothetical protein